MNDSQGRVALVTGGTDGIGRAVALALAQRGHRVMVVGRDPGRGAAVLAALRRARPGVEHAFLPADLSLLAHTARLADEVGRRTTRLDAAVFCAGVLALTPEWTAEGLERSLVLNYLSRYLLARRLLPALTRAPSGRLVFVANAGIYPDILDLDDLHHRRGKAGLFVAGRTQLANDLLAVELTERCRGTRVEVTCVFPGVNVRTSVWHNARGLPPAVRLLLPVLRLFARSPADAARTPVFLAHSPGAIGTGGHFYGPHLKERRVPAHVRRPERRAALWSASEDMVRAYLEPGPWPDAPRA